MKPSIRKWQSCYLTLKFELDAPYSNLLPFVVPKYLSNRNESTSSLHTIKLSFHRLMWIRMLFPVHRSSFDRIRCPLSTLRRETNEFHGIPISFIEEEKRDAWRSSDCFVPTHHHRLRATIPREASEEDFLNTNKSLPIASTLKSSSSI